MPFSRMRTAYTTKSDPRVVNTIILLVTAIAVVTMFTTFVNLQHQSRCNEEFRDGLTSLAYYSGEYQFSTHKLIMSISQLQQPLDRTSPEYEVYREQVQQLFTDYDQAYRDLVESRERNPLPAQC